MQISIPIPSHAQLHGGGFEAGFLHPVLGFDHLLAMVAVGIIATQRGGRETYVLPLIFVCVMLIGSLFGFKNINFFDDELAIQISLLALGLVISLEKKTSFLTTVVLIAFFAFFHGHAHGLELPKMHNAFKYAGGFIIATGLLHISGILLTYLLNKSPLGKKTVVYIGLLISGVGIYSLISSSNLI